MAPNSTGMHHLNVRKRIHKKHEKFPHPVEWKRILDTIIYPVGLIGPVIMIPQILKIYIEKNATSMAMISWIIFIIPAIIWVLYGFAHKNKAVIICNAAWVITYIFIIFGTVLYG